MLSISDVRHAYDRLAGSLRPRAGRPSTFRTTASVLRIGMAVVYLVAFLSLLAQVRGLLGPDGILPADRYLEAVRAALGGGPAVWLRVPSLAWLAPGGDGLVGLCLAGVASAILLGLGVAPLATAFSAWLLYLSLESVGQDFLAFQWDILLLEAGFLLLFLVPTGWWRPRCGKWGGPWFPAVWLFWWLLFRLILESGMVKLASGDPTWRDLTALTYHYHTQPIPNLVAWYADHLPVWFQKASTLVTFVIELAVPFLFLLRRRARIVGGLLLVGHQCLIALTGNFGFFNLLTIVIAASLFDDRFWHGLLLRLPHGRRLLWHLLRGERAHRRGPQRRGEPALREGGASGSERARAPALTGPLGVLERGRRIVSVGFLVVAVGVGAGQLVRAAGVAQVPGPLLATWRALSPFGVLNAYGLFATMTTRRPELAVEGRAGGGPWRELDFRWKADDPGQRPRQVAPYMPRLDWQMWFAALTAEREQGRGPGNSRYDAWLLSFVERLLAGAPAVWDLLAPDTPFRNSAGVIHVPDEIRIVLYNYRFTTFAEHAATGNWWARREVGVYLPPVVRTEDGRLREADGGG